MSQVTDWDLASVPTRAEGVIEAEVDGEIVIMSPKDYSYLGVAGSGRAIWDRIDGERTLGQVVENLLGEFDGDPDQVQRETLDFVGGLEVAGLVSIAKRSA